MFKSEFDITTWSRDDFYYFYWKLKLLTLVIKREEAMSMVVRKFEKVSPKKLNGIRIVLVKISAISFDRISFQGLYVEDRGTIEIDDKECIHPRPCVQGRALCNKIVYPSLRIRWYLAREGLISLVVHPYNSHGHVFWHRRSKDLLARPGHDST